eukprot:scaffold214977_cov43-Cyclotella_meneghiniana.AAC.1
MVSQRPRKNITHCVGNNLIAAAKYNSKTGVCDLDGLSSVKVSYEGCRPWFHGRRGFCVRILDVDVACSRMGVPNQCNGSVSTRIGTNESLAFAS